MATSVTGGTVKAVFQAPSWLRASTTSIGGSTAIVLLFLPPALFLFTLFVALPMGEAAWYSFYNWNGYGAPTDFSLPKTILFSVGPEEITADAEEWKKRGVDGFFLDFVARNWSTDVWAIDGEPWTIGASDKTLRHSFK